jgi:hypothetical protein
MPFSSLPFSRMTESSEEEEAHSQDAYVATTSEAFEPIGPASSAERASGKKKKKRLLTREKLLTVKNDKLRRQFAPIRNWSSLEIGKPYLFRRVVPIEVKRKRSGDSSNNWGLSHYAELVSVEEPLINAWLTPIMVKESENYHLGTEDFYIVPLGKRVSRENRREYQAFVIVPGNELVF